MRKYNIPHAFSGSLQLGRQGETGVTEITFLCAGYAKMYGDGFAELVHKAPNGTIYPVNIEQDESNRVTWLISDGDTATAGNGELELRWMVNGNLAKSKIFETIVQKTLTVSENPPEAVKSWVDKVLQAAEDIKSGAIDDEKLAKAIAEYLEKHPIEAGGITEAKAREIAQSVVDAFQETDPTVPDWAKAETKPAYTAAEVGAVPESAKSDIDKNTAARHTHGNKSALDIITADDISKWNSGTAGTVEIAGATALESGNAPTVTETTDSTERARKYLLGIPKGEKGDTGAQGADGKSAYQFAQDGGYTGTETDFVQKLNKETFANPYPLIFTGATSATYDGSESVTVDLSEGGGGGTSNFRLLRKIEVAADNNIKTFIISTDDNGNEFSCQKIIVYGLTSCAESKNQTVTFYINNKQTIGSLPIIKNVNYWGYSATYFFITNGKLDAVCRFSDRTKQEPGIEEALGFYNTALSGWVFASNLPIWDVSNITQIKIDCAVALTELSELWIWGA